jgi:hypothetical protein
VAIILKAGLTTSGLPQEGQTQNILSEKMCGESSLGLVIAGSKEEEVFSRVRFMLFFSINFVG